MSNLPQHIRTFVAVELPEDLRSALVLRCEPARAALGRALRWTRPDNIHLTVKFLGDVDRDDIPEAVNIIREAASGAHSLPAEVFGPEPFPAGAKARLVVAHVQHSDVLQHIYEGLDRGLARLGVKRERRAYTPHITLARARDFGGRWVSGFDWPSLAGKIGAMPVTALTLFMSELKPGGPDYTPLAKIDIG
jgi:2'-5' RNA ligase